MERSTRAHSSKGKFRLTRSGTRQPSPVSSGSSIVRGCPTVQRLRSSFGERTRAVGPKPPLFVKGLSITASSGYLLSDPDYDYTSFPEVVRTATDAYQQAGITDPRSQLAL